MLDIRFICDNKIEIERAMKNRGVEVPIAQLVSLNEARREKLKEVEDLKHRRNRSSGEIAVLKREKKDAAGLIKEMQEVSGSIKEIDTEVREIEGKIRELLLMVPNIPEDSVPVGKDAGKNKIVREELSDKREFDFEPREHADVGETLDILDIQAAVKLSESRFVMLMGKGALLERALTCFMLEQQIKNGYLEVIPPFMVNSKAMTGTGQLPKFEKELYRCRDDDLYLIPTAEVPLTNMHSGEILSGDKLPLKYVAGTPCFRREAGSYGKDTKGLIRNHQFNKVEIVRFTKPEDSSEQLEELLADAESILKLLKIPYRVVLLCTGDLGFGSARTYDLEMWMPGEKKWREVSSCSNFKDFQARRLNIRYRDRGKPVSFVHTLNGSGLAVGRTFAAVLENYQNGDGTVEVPEALRPYMNGLERIEK